MPTQTHFWFDCSGAEIPLKRSLMMLVYAQSSWAQSVSICKHDFPNVFPVFSLFQWHYWELASFLVFGNVPGLGIHNKLPGMFKMTQPPKEMWGGKNQKYCRFGIDFFPIQLAVTSARNHAGERRHSSTLSNCHDVITMGDWGALQKQGDVCSQNLTQINSRQLFSLSFLLKHKRKSYFCCNGLC